MSTLRRAFDVRTDTASGSVLLVRGMDAYELDPVGVAVWTLCDGRGADRRRGHGHLERRAGGGQPGRAVVRR